MINGDLDIIAWRFECECNNGEKFNHTEYATAAVNREFVERHCKDWVETHIKYIEGLKYPKKLKLKNIKIVGSDKFGTIYGSGESHDK